MKENFFKTRDYKFCIIIFSTFEYRDKIIEAQIFASKRSLNQREFYVFRKKAILLEKLGY